MHTAPPCLDKYEFSCAFGGLGSKGTHLGYMENPVQLIIVIVNEEYDHH